VSAPTALLVADAPAEWDALRALERAATPAHDPRVWAALAATLPGFEAKFVSVHDGARFLGGAPLLIERRGFGTWLHALPFLLSGAPLARRGHETLVDAAVAGAIERTAGELGASGGEWACDRPGAPVAPEALELVGGETRWFESARVALDAGLDAAWHAVDRKARQEIAHAGAAGLVFAEAPEAFDDAYALHAHQSRRWAGHRALPAALSRRLLDDGAARLFVVRDARGVLCATLALDGAHETFVWWSGAHDAARARRAYPVLMWGVAAWAAARGRARLNLGASTGLDAVAAFKRALGAKPSRYPVRWLDARHASALGRTLAAVQRRLRRGRARGAAA